MSNSNNDNPLFADDTNGPVATATAVPTPSNTNSNLMASLLGSNGGGGSGGGGGLFGDDDGGAVGGGGGKGASSLFGDHNEEEDEPPPFATSSSVASAPLPPAAPPLPPASVPTPTSSAPASAPHPPVVSTTTTTTGTMAPPNPPPPPVAPTPPAAPPAAALSSSLLMQSGLLPGGSSGGLFDEVDQQEAEEERKRQEAAAAAAAAAAAERQRQQEAERHRQEAAARQAQEDLQRQQQDSLMQQQQQQKQQQQQQQQLTDQMQSVYLGNTMAPPQQQQQQQQQQPSYGMAQSMPPSYANATSAYGSPQGQEQQHQFAQSQQFGAAHAPGFYRDHGSGGGMPGGSASYLDPSQQRQQQEKRYYQPSQTPSVLAGMHNGPVPQQAVLGRAPTSRLPVTEPPPVPTYYASCKVSEPLLIPGQALFGNAPHWSYQIATTLHPPPSSNAGASGGVWLVRRRFRHVVALEDRLREECPGAILPPRPDKHATRALEEASTQQSADFAVQRANELQVYLNQLINHPFAFSTHTLRLFLSLQDDLGTAWPEVSNNAFTRFANAGVGAAVKVSEQTQAAKFPWQDPMGHIDDYGEEDAELMALASQEQVRTAAVLQAVPKLEGSVTLLREGAELRGATGMELSRLSKEVETSDKELSYPMELVAGGMLRSGRRSKRMALELAAALETFVQQYKLCRYEKVAFTDRRVAIMRRNKERGKADQRAHQLLMQQQRQMYQQPYGGGPYGGNSTYAMQNHAVNADTLASDAVQECNEIGRRVKSEVNRIAWHRRQEWKAAVKVVASANKEAITENVAIWESVRESFLQAFPEA